MIGATKHSYLLRKQNIHQSGETHSYIIKEMSVVLLKTEKTTTRHSKVSALLYSIHQQRLKIVKKIVSYK